MKVQSLKMFKTTKDLFYKQFDFFCELTGPIMGLREPCLFDYYNEICTRRREIGEEAQKH